MSLGERICAARMAKGLTQRELAEMTGVSRGFIGDIECDRTAPSVKTTLKIAAALEVSVSSLLDDVNNLNGDDDD